MNTISIKHLVCEHFYLRNIRRSIELHQQWCLFNTEGSNSHDLILLISLVLIRTPSGRNYFAVLRIWGYEDLKLGSILNMNVKWPTVLFSRCFYTSEQLYIHLGLLPLLFIHSLQFLKKNQY